MFEYGSTASRGAFVLLALVGFGSACATAGDGASVDVAASPSMPDAATAWDGGGGVADAGFAYDAGIRSDSGAPRDSGATLDAGVTKDATEMDAGTAIDASTADTGVVDAGATDGNVLCAQHGFSGTLVAFDLSGQSGSEASAPPASMASGVSAGPLARSGALSANAVTGSGSMNTNGWPTSGSPDDLRYYTFTITAPATCAVTLSSLAIAVRASATGPSAASLATSEDGFASRVPFGTTGAVNVAITSANNASGTIELRIYGYSATGSGGTFRVENLLTLSGSLD